MSNLMALLPSRRRIIRREILWQWLLNRGPTMQPAGDLDVGSGAKGIGNVPGFDKAHPGIEVLSKQGDLLIERGLQASGSRKQQPHEQPNQGSID